MVGLPGLCYSAIALSVLLVGAERGAAQTTNAEPKILFLHLKLTSNDVALVKSSDHPGVVKPQPNAETKEIQIELVSKQGNVLWSGAMDDPRVRHVEFEDPPRSGQLRRKTVYVEEAEVTVRVPLLAEARRIVFYTSGPSPAHEKGEKLPNRKLLGSVPLPADTECVP